MASLRNIQPGQFVCTDRHGQIAVYQIERVTATQAVTKNGPRFLLSSGRVVGGTSYSPYARVASEADMISWRINLAQVALERFRVTDKNLALVEAMLKEVNHV